jgi:hypothetical protein
MTNETLRSDFADFLERLAACKGRCGMIDWQTFAVNHYHDEEIEEMRRTVVRLGISWAYGDWPEINCELVQGWAKRLRQSGVA